MAKKMGGDVKSVGSLHGSSEFPEVRSFAHNSSHSSAMVQALPRWYTSRNIWEAKKMV